MPENGSTLERWLPWFGVVGFYWFMLTGFWGRSGHHIALGLLVLFFLYWLRSNWGLIRRSSLFWVALAFSAYVSVRAGLGYWEAPETYIWQLRYGWAFIAIGGLLGVLLAPWLMGSKAESRLNWAFVAVVLSLFIQVFLEIFVHPDGEGISEIIRSRPGFQMGPNTFGLLCGILLLGILALGRRWLGQIPWGQGVPVQAFIVLPALLLAIGGLFLGLLISQSRASWLGAAITLPFVVGGLLWLRNPEGSGFSRRFVLALSGGGLLLVGGLLITQWDLLESRVVGEWSTIEKVASFQLQGLQDNAVGKRIWLWRTALGAFGEQPLFGWSPAGVRGLIDERIPVHVPHNFHNVPLQIGVALGATGLLLFFSMIWFSGREIYLATRSGRFPLEWGLFWWGALLFLGVESLFDFPMYDMEYRFFVLFLGAIAMAAQLERLRLEQSDLWSPRGTQGVDSVSDQASSSLDRVGHASVPH